jgi:hypothetical protein
MKERKQKIYPATKSYEGGLDKRLKTPEYAIAGCSVGHGMQNQAGARQESQTQSGLTDDSARSRKSHQQQDTTRVKFCFLLSA